MPMDLNLDRIASHFTIEQLQSHYYIVAIAAVLLVAAAYYLGRRSVPKPAHCHSVFRKLDEVILGVNKDARIVGWNDEAIRQLGMTPEKLRHFDVRAFFPESEQGIIGRVMAQASIGGELPETALLLHAHGEERRFYLRCVVDEDFGTSEVAYWLVLRGENDLDVARTELHRHSCLCDLAAGTSMVHFGVWDLLEKRFEWSASWPKEFGYSHDWCNVAEETWETVIRPEDVESFKDCIEGLLAGESSTGVAEIRIKQKPDVWRWVQTRMRVMERNSAGTPVKIALVLLDVNEVKSAKVAVQDHEYRMRCVFDGAGVGLVKLDRECRCTMVNRTLATMLEMNPSKLEGELLPELMPVDDRQGAADYFKQVLTGVVDGMPLETRFANKRGALVPVELRASAMRDGERQVAAVIVSVVDISQRRRLEEMLLEACDRFQTVVAGAEIGVWEWSREANDLVKANEHFREMVGLSEDDCSWRAWREVIHPEDRSEALVQLQAVFAGDRALIDVDFRVRLEDGGERWLRTRAKVRDERLSKGDRQVVGVVQDITEICEAERILEQFRAQGMQENDVLDMGLTGMFRISSEGDLRQCNAAMAKLLGYASPDDCVAAVHDIADQHAQSPADFHEFLASAAREGVAARYETKLHDSRGKEVHVLISAKAAFRSDGAFDYLEGSVEDISERRTAKEKLREAERIVETAQSVKARFLAAVGEEMRRPMSAMLKRIESLRELTADSAGRSELLSDIEIDGRLLLEWMDDIQDLFDLETNSLAIEATTCSFPEILGRIAKDETARAKENGLTLDMRFANEVPERISVDGRRLRQVVRNVVESTIRTAGDGGVRIEVGAARSSSDPEKATLVIAVATASDEAAHASPTAVTIAPVSTEGSGLGLTLAQQLAGKMGGSIQAEKRPGGQCFLVQIPVAVAADVAWLKDSAEPRAATVKS